MNFFEKILKLIKMFISKYLFVSNYHVCVFTDGKWNPVTEIIEQQYIDYLDKKPIVGLNSIHSINSIVSLNPCERPHGLALFNGLPFTDLFNIKYLKNGKFVKTPDDLKYAFLDYMYNFYKPYNENSNNTIQSKTYKSDNGNEFTIYNDKAKIRIDGYYDTDRISGDTDEMNAAQGWYNRVFESY